MSTQLWRGHSCPPRRHSCRRAWRRYPQQRVDTSVDVARRSACATLLALILSLPCAGQVIVSPARLRRTLSIFDAQPGETALRCEVTPIRPALNFSFRFQAGYRVMVPANQYLGKGHRWTVLTRITPQSGDRKPVYLASAQNLPDIPKTNVPLQLGGGYLLGEGAYDVNWVLLDDQDRVCRKTWRVDVRLSRAERKVQVAMPHDTVWDFTLRGARLQPHDTDDAAPLRLTVLLNAAPLSPRRMRLRGGDILILISTVSTLLERVPASAVRLVVFNLEHQKELYRKPDFVLRNIPEVARAMNSIDLNTVDFQVLQNQRGHVDLLAGLLNQEINAPDPSDVVLFIGPISRYEDRFPAAALDKAPGRTPQFFDLQIAPFMRSSTSTLPDVIRNATSRLGGKTVQVHSPGEFARAIEMLERTGQKPAALH